VARRSEVTPAAISFLSELIPERACNTHWAAHATRAGTVRCAMGIRGEMGPLSLACHYTGATTGSLVSC